MRKKIIAIILILIFVLPANAAWASSTAGELFDFQSILAPGAARPEPKEKPASYRNPYMSYLPFEYVKGGVRYADFAGLPDFGQFARLGGLHTLVYPPSVNEFYFIGAPDVTYTYRSRIIDYIGASAETVKGYKAFIKALGFVNRKNLDSDVFPEYAEIIGWQLRYDSDFKLDGDGIYVVEDAETFRWLLIGKSVAYNSVGELVDCTELRFYSLTRTDNFGLGILFEAGDLGETEGVSDVFFVTPDAIDDVGDTTAPPARGLATPDALSDIQQVQGPQQSNYGTPDAVTDVNAFKNLMTGGG